MANILGSGQTDLSGALSNNFRVVVEKLPTIAFFATETSIPGFDAAGVGVNTPVQDFNVQADKIEWSPLEFGFILDEGFFSYEEVYSWCWDTVFPTNPSEAKLKFTDATVIVLDNNKNPVINIHFRNCFPIGMSGVEYKTVGEASGLTARVKLLYTYFELERVATLSPPVPPAAVLPSIS